MKRVYGKYCKIPIVVVNVCHDHERAPLPLLAETDDVNDGSIIYVLYLLYTAFVLEMGTYAMH